MTYSKTHFPQVSFAGTCKKPVFTFKSKHRKASRIGPAEEALALVEKCYFL